MRRISKFASETLVAASIIIGVMTFSLGYLHQLSAKRNELTFRLMLQVIASESPVHQANLTFAQWIRDGKSFANDDVSTTEDDAIIRLIDFYDVVADASMRGIVDKQMVITHLGGRMRAAHHVVDDYIDARRKKLGRPNLYLPFETFVAEHIGTQQL